MTTRVINIKSKEPYDVYIGRWNWQVRISSKWRNPYKISKVASDQEQERQRVISKYKEYLLNKPELLKLIPIEIKDKVLGCWCAPKPCHGDVLAELADK
jgi:hypothetical protein